MSLINPQELVIQSWKLYIKNFKLLIKIIVWVLLFSILLTFTPYLRPLGLAAIPINILLSLAAFVVSIWISIALALTIKNLYKNEPVDLKAIYRESYSKILSYFWISFLTGILILAGTILFIIPGLIFAVWFSFALYVLIFENIKGFKALKRSKELVKNYFWSVVWRWIAPYVFYIVIIIGIIYIPIYFIGLLMGAPSAGLRTPPPLWSSLISNIISVIAIPIFTSIGVILYHDLKREKETTK
jgi:hypothetical protein